MSDHYHSEQFTHPMHDGWVLEMRLHADDDADPPWERGFMRGEVRELHIAACRRCYGSHATGKRPGERVLGWTGRGAWAYDWAGAVAQCRKEGSSGPDAVKAANAEFKYLHRWCGGDWFYCGVVVRIISCPPQYKACLDDQGEYAYALWGIESDAEDYLKETTKGLADDAIMAVREAHAVVAFEAQLERLRAEKVEAQKAACPHCRQRSNPAGWCHVGTQIEDMGDDVMDNNSENLE